jgi:hypothetical protein
MGGVTEYSQYVNKFKLDIMKILNYASNYAAFQKMNLLRTLNAK